jgi:hypothetical protein
MVRNSWKLLYLMAGAALPLAAQEFVLQQDELPQEEAVYVYEESIAYPENEREYSCFTVPCRNASQDITIGDDEPVGDVIEKVGKVMLQSQLIPFDLDKSLSEDELRALTREYLVNTEHGRLSVSSMKRMSFMFDQLPAHVRPVMECYLFEPRALRLLNDDRSMTLGEVFDLSCECARELHEATTALLPGVPAQKIAAIWGFYVPSLVLARWITDDISESQVREIIAIQKQVLNRFVMAALPHLCTMWVRLAPVLPQIREALQEPASNLLLDLQHIAEELAQRRYDFDHCECGDHSDAQDRASEICVTEVCGVENEDACPCNQRPAQRDCFIDSAEEIAEYVTSLDDIAVQK